MSQQQQLSIPAIPLCVFFLCFSRVCEHLRSVISLEESILFDGFTPGRRSFRGFNPLIESLATERAAEDLVAQARKGADAAPGSSTALPEDADADTPITAFSNGPHRAPRRSPAQAARARQMERVLMPAATKPVAAPRGRAGKQQQQPARRH